MMGEVLDSGVSTKWLEGELKSWAGLKAVEGGHVVSHSACRVGADNGFISNIYAVGLNWSEPTTLPNSLILKVPSEASFQALGEQEHLVEKPNTDWVAQFHNAECKFYELWKDEAPPFAIPKCYLAVPYGSRTGRPALALENLSQNGCVPPLHKGLNLPQALSVADFLGRLQGWGLLNPKKIERFAENKPTKEQVKNMIEGLFKSLCADMFSHFPDIFHGKAVDSFIKLFDDFNNFNVIWTAEDRGVPLALCHQDLWPNNMLFQTNSGSAGDDLAGIIDWQGTFLGLPATDLCRFTMGFVETSVRREQLDQVLKQYWKSLEETAGAGNIPWRRDEVAEQWKELMPWGGMFAVLTVALVWGRSGSRMGSAKEVESLMQRLGDMIFDLHDILSDKKPEFSCFHL